MVSECTPGLPSCDYSTQAFPYQALPPLILHGGSKVITRNNCMCAKESLGVRLIQYMKYMYVHVQHVHVYSVTEFPCCNCPCNVTFMNRNRHGVVARDIAIGDAMKNTLSLPRSTSFPNLIISPTAIVSPSSVAVSVLPTFMYVSMPYSSYCFCGLKQLPLAKLLIVFTLYMFVLYTCM